MFFFEGEPRAIIAPSDLRVASECEYALLRELDVLLKRRPEPDPVHDEMLDRTVELGEAHEQAELDRLRRRHPEGVVTVPRPARTRIAYERAREATLAALGSDAQVVYQAVFCDERSVGFADFLVREDDGWTVVDTKLARSESVAALLQIAAYAEALQAEGVPTSPVARLVLGSGDQRDYRLSEILPVLRARRERLITVLDTHQDEPGPVRWGDERWLACGRCAACQEELAAHRDVALAGGVHTNQRQRLLAAGVSTIEQLAARTEPVPEMGTDQLARLQAQARLQLEGEQAGRVLHEVWSPQSLSVIPPPSEGDIFFDFEGDPLWAEPGSTDWGLEYLFGCLTRDGGQEQFTPFWAHDRAEEKAALRNFLDWVADRRRRWPDLHIYHYAPYERTALLRLAVRHATGEAEVDRLLSEGVLVDLYAVVRSSIRVSERSYSIKKLEPLYMTGQREGVTNAADSIVQYHHFCQARRDGAEEKAARILKDIREYNQDDCRSTLGLRDWLLDRAAEAGVTSALGRLDEAPAEVAEPRPETAAAEALETALLAPLLDVRRTDRDADQQARAMTAGAIQFHRRENKPHWWAHFDRLRLPVSEWVRSSDVFAVEAAQVVQDWHRPTPRSQPHRTLALDGRFLGSTSWSAGSSVVAVYVDPWPEGMDHQPDHVHAAKGSVTVSEVTELDDGRHRVTLDEGLAKVMPQHDQLPVGLMPGSPLMTRSIDEALAELATEVHEGPDLPRRAGMDLLRRVPPRLHSGDALPRPGDGPDRYVQAIEAALLDLDDSYLAVQGPPGTGKTYVGSRVIARLVRRGWKVGVTAQSHAAVENVLAACVRAGVDPSAVVKEEHHGATRPTWTVTGKNKATALLAGLSGGYVFGGTVWDLTNTKRVERGQLDLLVVDEAGQLSLAKTLAASLSADRLLLLGDPQQLPQVSQGTHPEPVDESALGWLLQSEPVMPAELGYFLETTWRMHPALTDRVSTLSYAGTLRSHEPVTAARHLDGVAPGVHVVDVDHRHHTTESPEEAAAVVGLARDLLGRSWHDPQERDTEDRPRGPRPLGQADLIVVTPYNRQVHRLRHALDEAGLTEVPVGTVDKFQGQEAAVAILSMAASAREDVPRGIGFLLDRNRLNVSISRGQWAAFIVRSSVLTDFAPRTPGELRALGAFITLCEGG